MTDIKERGDQMEEACGVFGIYAQDESINVAEAAYYGLFALQHRGQESAGIAVADGKGIKHYRNLGLVPEVFDEEILHGLTGRISIGHVRYSTFGSKDVINSQPLVARCKIGMLALAHNGNLVNADALRAQMEDDGAIFQTSVDTEVILSLIARESSKGLIEAIRSMMEKVRGSYALGILFGDQPGVIYAARKDSPLILGRCDGEYQGHMIASDVPAVLNYTRNVVYIDNQEIACLTRDELHVYNIDCEEIEKLFVEIKWDAAAAEKDGYEHFMMKEIHEQPRAVRDTLSPRIKENESGERYIDLSETGLTDEDFAAVSRVYLIGCGSAYHVGMAARYVLEKAARVPCEVDLASEFRYRDPILEESGLVIIISQSGETADSLAALRLCKERGVRTLAVVNVVGSSIAREADSVIYTWAGPEIAVATTKAYSTQLAALYLIAVHMAEVRGQITPARREALIDAMLALPDQIERVLSDKERVQWYANKMAACKDVFFIGRGLDYAISMEGSLKLKEISYIHSEAYAAGELKHGTISLIEDGVLVVAVATQPELFEKEVSNMVEVRSRGASLFGLTTYGQYAIEDTVNFTVYVPRTDPLLTTSLAVVPLQLLAYYISCAKGLDVDKPRNLAKSVTVE